jgi:G:T-mismatch repair DNA endonuclease (very short patch repair protein)
MMTLHGGAERTESQWQRLLQSAGLRIVKVWHCEEKDEGSEAVIECEKL